MSHWILFPEDVAYVEVVVLEPGQSRLCPEGKHWVKITFKNYEWVKMVGEVETSRSERPPSTSTEFEVEMLEIVTDLKQSEEEGND